MTRLAVAAAALALVLSAGATADVDAAGARQAGKRFYYSMTVRGTVTASWSLNARFGTARTCLTSASGSGRETVAFGLERPQRVLVMLDYETPSYAQFGAVILRPFPRVKATATRAGSFSYTNSGSVIQVVGGREVNTCYPGTYTAPASGCGSASGVSAKPPGYGAWVAIQSGNRTRGSRDFTARVMPLAAWSDFATPLPRETGLREPFPPARRLSPCPSGAWGVSDAIRRSGWHAPEEMHVSVGALAVRNTGVCARARRLCAFPELPRRFWHRRTLTVRVMDSYERGIWAKRGPGVGANVKAGIERGTLAMLATFTRARS